MKKIVFAALFLIGSAVAYAGGYRVSLQGQRALAMGHTGVAVVNSAELGFFNPAGLVYLENRLNVSAGISAVFAETIWQNTEFGQWSRTESSPGTPFYVYASYKANDWLTVGITAYTPYGSNVEWPEDWPGSHLVNSIDLRALYLQPVVSVKLSEFFSLGGGPVYVTGGVNYSSNLNRSLTDIEGDRSSVSLEARGVDAWGWSAAAMFSPSEKFRIGFHYRSEVILEAKNGDAVFSDIPNSPLMPFENTAFDASLPLPAELALGMSWKFRDKWLFAFDYNQTFWSVYESLDIDFHDPAISDSRNLRNYEDSSTFRFGFQYDATKDFSLRAGYYLDESPVRKDRFSPETPRNTGHGFTGGLSLDVTERLAIDAAFVYIRYDEVNASYDPYFENGVQVPFGGTYKSAVFVPGIGLTYKI